MNVTGLFIVRPVMTTLVMAAFYHLWRISYALLPVNDLPSVDFPTITVTASVPGANADTMAAYRCHAAGKAIHHHCRAR